MARQVNAPDNQIRVVFQAAEIEAFLAGRQPVPDYGGDDPLNRAIQRCYDALNDAFPDAGQYVEPFVEPATWLRDPEHAWYVINFRFPNFAVERVGHDAGRLADWIAERTPDLLFAVEDEAGRSIRIQVPRGRAR